MLYRFDSGPGHHEIKEALWIMHRKASLDYIDHIYNIYCGGLMMIEFLGDWKRSHYCGAITAADIGSEVMLMGWAHRRRDHGGLIFIDLRDREGLAQVVFDPAVSSETHAKAESVRSEYVLAVKGKVIPRPAGTVNPNLKTGEVEVVVTECKLLNPSKSLPFTLDEHVDVAENIRLKYRYLDLRRPQLQENIILRSKVAQTTRRYLSENGFLEIETPFLTKSTPEGATRLPCSFPHQPRPVLCAAAITADIQADSDDCRL